MNLVSYILKRFNAFVYLGSMHIRLKRWSKTQSLYCRLIQVYGVVLISKNRTHRVSDLPLS
jgi:hypothetical protein